jgi:hypothetical protein
MPLYKWTIEVLTDYEDTGYAAQSEIILRLQKDQYVFDLEHRSEPLTLEQVKAQFKVPEETLDKYYPRCTFCGKARKSGAEVEPDAAMTKQFALWNVDCHRFRYCDEQCRLLHLFEFYQKKEAPKYVAK